MGDILKDSDDPRSETSLSGVRDCSRINSTGADAIHTSTYDTSTKETKIEDEISLLLLSDKPFLTRAAELIGVGVCGDLSNQRDRISKAGTKLLALSGRGRRATGAEAPPAEQHVALR